MRELFGLYFDHPRLGQNSFYEPPEQTERAFVGLILKILPSHILTKRLSNAL